MKTILTKVNTEMSISIDLSAATYHIMMIETARLKRGYEITGTFAHIKVIIQR